MLCPPAGPCAACPAAQSRRSSPIFTHMDARYVTSAPIAPNSSPMSFPPVAAAWTSSTTPPKDRLELLLLLLLLLLKDRSLRVNPTTKPILHQALILILHLTPCHSITLSSLLSPTISSRGLRRHLLPPCHSATPRPSAVWTTEQTDWHFIASCQHTPSWVGPQHYTAHRETLEKSVSLRGLVVLCISTDRNK